MSATIRHAFATRAIHHGYDPQQYLGALCPPVFMSSIFAFPTAEFGGACFAGSGVFFRHGGDNRLLLDAAGAGR